MKMPAEPLEIPSTKLYEEDFLAWTGETARLLRTRQFDRVDLEALIEEVESMGASQWREMESRLRVLIQHLLKWKHQATNRSTSWRSTIDTQRFELDRLMRQSPSLRSGLSNSVAEVYPHAVRAASLETGLPAETFPDRCPFPPDQILAADFLPD